MSRNADMTKIVNNYVDCWKSHYPNHKFSGTRFNERNFFECDQKFLIFGNGFNIETFSFEELTHLSAVTIKTLEWQINLDHKIAWSWHAFVADAAKQIGILPQTSTFDDWVESFKALVHLVLASRRFAPEIGMFPEYDVNMQYYVNTHLIWVEQMYRYTVAYPLAFAVLEGLLRRKNSKYISLEGEILSTFTVRDSNNKPKEYHANNRKQRLNQIDDSFRLFEQIITKERNRQCLGLTELKKEVATLFGSPDVYEMLAEWRNAVMHGNEYWMSKVPIILNFICLLLIDEIDPSLYNNKLVALQLKLKQLKESQTNPNWKLPWIIYPPDFERCV